MAAWAVGCGGDPDPSPDEVTIAQVQAAVAPVESALAHPSGHVAQSNVGLIFEAIQHQGVASKAAAYAPGASSPPGASPQNTDSASCFAAGPGGGSVDMACASDGAVTGTMTYSFAVKGDTIYMAFGYNHVCADDVCIDGSGAQKYVVQQGGGFSAVLSGDLTVQQGTQTTDVHYGYAMASDGDNVTLQYVVFVDGASYVVTHESDGSTYTYGVTGENGSFTCTATQQGDEWTGTCSGTSGEFSF